jgi:uncharacterized protein (DUF1501 family)
MKHPSTSRRQFVLAASSLPIIGAVSTGLSFAASPAATGERRFVLIQLRGGLDGLTAVPPTGDPQYEEMRAGLALPRTGDGASIALDSFFGLHPSLQTFHSLYRQRELLIVHAVATPYRLRSHFDAQNLLETGAVRPFSVQTGWLNRALQVAMPAGRESAVALTSAVPLVLQGPALVSNRAPQYTRSVGEDTLMRIARMYEPHDDLVAALTRAKHALGAPHRAKNSDSVGAEHPWVSAAEGASLLLSLPNGPRVAVIDTEGWDSHATQFSPIGIPGRNLRALDLALSRLRTGLGEHWKNTVVAVVTEFGRTVQPNGSGGTDHGTAGAMFLIGGAVAGGRVIADWPGLARHRLYDEQDLRPTSDLFAVLAGALADHWNVSSKTLAQVIAPDRQIQVVGGLIRA